jgi:hypothetical protein
MSFFPLKHSSFLSLLSLLFLGLSIFFLGIFIGIILENIREGEQKKFTFYPPLNAQQNIPVLHFETIENGILKGKVEHGQVRIIIPKSEIEIISPENNALPHKNFSISLAEILPMLKKIPAPENAQFVASKRGKKFYALDDPRAFLVSAKNRIFFFSKEEAEEKGFTKF